MRFSSPSGRQSRPQRGRPIIIICRKTTLPTTSHNDGAGREVFNRIICQVFTCGSDRLFQFLCWPKGNLLAGGYLHCLSSGRIASCARLALANLKRSKATDSDAVPLLQVPCHALHHSREQILRQLLRCPSA